MTPIERFAAYIVGKPLYPYQAEVANAIMHSINQRLGWLITVMMSRQAGKNQTRIGNTGVILPTSA